VRQRTTERARLLMARVMAAISSVGETATYLVDLSPRRSEPRELHGWTANGIVMDKRPNGKEPEENDLAAPESPRTEGRRPDRRAALKRFGKYAAYAAPALLAMTSAAKADCPPSTIC
jgi:hypothetical protein